MPEIDFSAPMGEEAYRKLKAVLKAVQEQHEAQLPLFTAARRAVENDGIPAHGRVLNVLQFAILSHYELACLLEDMADHNSSFRGRLYARLLIVNIYETTHKLQSLLGRQLRADFLEAGVSKQEMDTLGKIHQAFVRLHEECDRRYGDVRNGIGAHKDPSAETQLELIEKANIHDVTNLVIEILKWTAGLTRLCAIYGNLVGLMQTAPDAK
jgi:hypothetical protein